METSEIVIVIFLFLVNVVNDWFLTQNDYELKSEISGVIAEACVENQKQKKSNTIGNYWVAAWNLIFIHHQFQLPANTPCNTGHSLPYHFSLHCALPGLAIRSGQLVVLWKNKPVYIPPLSCWLSFRLKHSPHTFRLPYSLTS